MKTCYVVMSTFNSPIAFVIPTPRAVFTNLKQAKEFCKQHNDSARTSTEYYIRKAEMK